MDSKIRNLLKRSISAMEGQMTLSGMIGKDWAKISSPTKIGRIFKKEVKAGLWGLSYHGKNGQNAALYSKI